MVLLRKEWGGPLTGKGSSYCEDTFETVTHRSVRGISVVEFNECETMGQDPTEGPTTGGVGRSRDVERVQQGGVPSGGVGERETLQPGNVNGVETVSTDGTRWGDYRNPDLNGTSFLFPSSSTSSSSQTRQFLIFGSLS